MKTHQSFDLKCYINIVNVDVKTIESVIFHNLISIVIQCDSNGDDHLQYSSQKSGI